MTPNCTTQTHAPAPPSTGPCPHDCGWPRCNGTTKPNTPGAARCRRQPIKGGAVCPTHGGSAPQVKAAAAERQAEEAAGKVLAKIWNPDAEPVTDAVAGMQRLAGQLRSALEALGARIEDGDLEGPAVVAWQRVVRELRQLLEAMERLGIAQRYVQVEAARVGLIAQALEHGLLDVEAGLTVVQRERVGRLVMAELRAGAGSGVGA